MIPFNKATITGNELEYISQVIASKKLSGDGVFTNKCAQFFESKYGFKKALLTTSCTDALEMCAILCDIQVGDEIIAPSYTFVSTVNAFILRGATVRFTDSQTDNPNMDGDLIEPLINSKTKAIICVHYAGIPCDMDKLVALANKHHLFLIEDAAQAIDSYYKGKAIGSFGHFGVFSFHETKNITCGEGGLLVINDEAYIKRAEIIRDKGTNRKSFLKGEVDKYGWVDIGSSFLPSELNAAFLFAQLEKLDDIQQKRRINWELYFDELIDLQNSKKISLPSIPNFIINGVHTFYIICNDENERSDLINYLNENKIKAFFHHISLHNSIYFKNKHDGRDLPMAIHFTNCLLRLPLYDELTKDQIKSITMAIKQFYLTER